jgi:hypothetical protein
MGLSAGAQCKRAHEFKFGHATDVECSCPSKRRCQLHSVSGALPPGKIVLRETIICASIVDAARRNLAALLAAVMGHLFSVVDDSDRIFSQRQIVVDSTRCMIVNEST